MTEENTQMEYVVTGDTAAPITQEELDARKNEIAMKLAYLKVLAEQRKRDAVLKPERARRKAKNRVKNKMAKASRKRNRGK